jgi:hypothetical protein
MQGPRGPGFGFIDKDTVCPLEGSSMPTGLTLHKDPMIHLRYNRHLGQTLPEAGTELTFRLRPLDGGGTEVFETELYRK